MSSPVTPASDRRNKPSKKEQRSKKRLRETADNTEASERKHKKSKSRVSLGDGDGIAADQPESSALAPPEAHDVGADRKKSKKYKADIAIDEEPKAEAAEGDGKHKEKSRKQLGGNVQDGAPSKEKKKSKKDKRRNDTQEGEIAAADVDVAQAAVIPDSQEALSSQQKRKKKEKRKEKQSETVQPMDVDPTPSQRTPATSQAHGDRPDVSFPFFTQTVSQYLPLFPSGMVEPIEGYAEQHLRPLLNRYVPAFRGVLLSYRNPRIGEAPGKGSLTEASQMEDTALLESIDEYAMGFSWLTVEADLFCPKRGSWMEGSLNLQSEGFIGVICFGMFNASIEASRLPSGWKWVDLLSKKDGKQQNGKSAAEANLPTPEPQDENEEEDGTDQAHSTGYWVDESGSKVGGKLRFRIKNYEVGSVGDYGYLSIEGTMLDEEAERAKVAEEMEADRRRKLKHGGLLRKPFKRLPEFSMTKFGKDDEQEEDILRSNKSKPNRPGTAASE
ncbi:hypothetical protein DL765_010037 [Monosporascus sp. GIB2]|nr:hypothetical protein DL765_010037 [Monosporascus sp. GIB2]